MKVSRSEIWTTKITGFVNAVSPAAGIASIAIARPPVWWSTIAMALNCAGRRNGPSSLSPGRTSLEIFTSSMRQLLREAQGAAAHNGLLRSRDRHGDDLFDFLKLPTSSRRAEVFGDVVGFGPSLAFGLHPTLRFSFGIEFPGKRHRDLPTL